MSAHVLLILLNELGKRDKMRGLPSILSLFRNESNKYKTRARILAYIYTYFPIAMVGAFSLSCTSPCHSGIGYCL